MLDLSRVELVAVSSVHLDLTYRALVESSQNIRFSSVKLFTDKALHVSDGVELIEIAPLRSANDYSRFILNDLAAHVRADFVLIIQWDGYVLNPDAWTDTFLDYDYIGARWPQFTDDHVVGNGGFSLRSRKLLAACEAAQMALECAEDVLICRTNRLLLEQEYGIKFAPPSVADRFSYERTEPELPTFGFHGIFNMVKILGPNGFQTAYALAERNHIGGREVLDCLFNLLKGGEFRFPRLTLKLLFDWLRTKIKK